MEARVGGARVGAFAEIQEYAREVVWDCIVQCWDACSLEPSSKANAENTLEECCRHMDPSKWPFRSTIEQCSTNPNGDCL